MSPAARDGLCGRFDDPAGDESTSKGSLDDPDGLLEGSCKKMRHVKIGSKSDIKRKRFSAWIREAGRR
ncbi:MAG TPA: hypothetical protein EYN79_06870 [Planctomycetes bacterium]|nr:hypothetical protein [Planctomycetota bacterium]